jgi:hypothetical protein
MTMLDRLTWACVGFLGVAVAIIVLSPMKQDKQPSDTPRTGTEMCREVAHELNQQYAEEMITRERAQEIIDRCHRLYTK